MVQVRKPDGKFGGRATDIKKSDVNNAIRLVMDETYNEVNVSIRKPVVIRTSGEITHSLGILEFVVYAALGVSLTFLAVAGTLYIQARI